MSTKGEIGRIQPQAELFHVSENIKPGMRHFRHFNDFFGMDGFEMMIWRCFVSLQRFAGNIQEIRPIRLAERGIGLDEIEQRVRYPLAYGRNDHHPVVQKLGIGEILADLEFRTLEKRVNFVIQPFFYGSGSCGHRICLDKCPDNIDNIPSIHPKNRSNAFPMISFPKELPLEI